VEHTGLHPLQGLHTQEQQQHSPCEQEGQALRNVPASVGRGWGGGGQQGRNLIIRQYS
jgi:hypothetical protein